MNLEQTPTGLWVPPRFNVNRMHKRVRTVTIPGRGRAKVTVDDSGTTTQVESDERLDAVVRPTTIRYALRRQR